MPVITDVSITKDIKLFVSKLLGFIGMVYILLVITFGYLSYELFQQIIFDIPDLKSGVFTKPIFNITIGIIYLFISIPGLILLWMSEVGHKLNTISSNTYRHESRIPDIRD